MIKASDTKVQFFTREDCPLCQQAWDVLEASAPELAAGAQVCHIEERISWLRDYRDRIPVVRRADTGAELCWPFAEEDVAEFLS